MFGLKKTEELERALQEKYGGRQEDLVMVMSLFTVCHHLIKADHKGMRMKFFVRWPVVEIWIENFRLASPDADRTAFSVNAPYRTHVFVKPVPGLFKGKNIPAFTNDLNDKEAIRRFCAAEENERDILALGLGKGEFLVVSGRQLIA